MGVNDVVRGVPAGTFRQNAATILDTLAVASGEDVLEALAEAGKFPAPPAKPAPVTRIRATKASIRS